MGPSCPSEVLWSLIFGGTMPILPTGIHLFCPCCFHLVACWFSAKRRTSRTCMGSLTEHLMSSTQTWQIGPLRPEHVGWEMSIPQRQPTGQVARWKRLLARLCKGLATLIEVFVAPRPTNFCNHVACGGRNATPSQFDIFLQQSRLLLQLLLDKVVK